MNIYLIRHTSVDVPKGLCYGQSDVPLRPTFEIEAAVTKAKIESIHFDMAYTSHSIQMHPSGTVLRIRRCHP